ncbi:MAG: biopolymer transporter ExbD [Cyanobacteria bacterium P01_D01_bin.105]
MHLPEDPDIQRPSVNILPMIDVIFAILAFFIVSSLYLTRAEGLPVNLPSAVTATPQNKIDVTLTVTAEGELFLSDEPVELVNLANSVSDLAPDRPIVVTIRADESTGHGRVVAAMDELRKVERVRLAIATTQP